MLSAQRMVKWLVTKEYVVDCGVIDWAFEKTMRGWGKGCFEEWRNVEKC
jgi:hypothetical protein